MHTNMDWLNKRGVSNEIINQFHIHWGIHPSFDTECIVIPVYTNENPTPLFNKYRRNPADDRKPKYLYDKGSRTALYGLNHITPTHNTVVITEGELDSLVLWSMNIPAVSSTGGALSFQEEWVPFLQDKEVFICFDNDDAGAEGAVRTLSYLPNAKVVFIPEQPNIKDISDFVSRGGDFRTLLTTALSYPDETSIIEDMNKRSASWLPTRFHSAWIKKHQEQQQRFTYQSKKIDSSDRLLRAKEYPIPKLLKFNKDRNALCLFHKESTPSLHYYQKTNSTYCFGGCGKAYDAIAIYQNLNGVDFRTALDDLNRLL